MSESFSDSWHSRRLGNKRYHIAKQAYILHVHTPVQFCYNGVISILID